MKKIIVIIATLVLLQLLFVSASYAAPPAQGEGWGQGGGRNNCGRSCYTVRYGDTLFSIGRRFNVNPWYLAQINQLRNPNWIYAGQRLTIPTGGPCCAPPYPWPAHNRQPWSMPYDGGYGPGHDGYGGNDGYGGYGNGYGYGADPQYSDDGQYGYYGDYPSYGYGMGVDPQYSEAGQYTYYGDYPSYGYGAGAAPQYDEAGQLSYGDNSGYDYGTEN